MHSTVRLFGEKLAGIVFGHIDRGSPFVLFTIERVHTYVWDLKGRVGYGRDAALPIMQLYIPIDAAVTFFELHAEDSYQNSGTLDAFVTPYWHSAIDRTSNN